LNFFFGAAPHPELGKMTSWAIPYEENEVRSRVCHCQEWRSDRFVYARPDDASSRNMQHNARDRFIKPLLSASQSCSLSSGSSKNGIAHNFILTMQYFQGAEAFAKSLKLHEIQSWVSRTLGSKQHQSRKKCRLAVPSFL